MLEVKNLCYQYQKTQKHAIEDVFFHVDDGEVFAILGKAGAGKTAISGLICGIYDMKKGNILIDDIDIKRNPIKFRDSIGVVFKNPRFYNRLSAKQNLQFFSNLHNKKCAKIQDVLSQVGLIDDINKKVHKFSFNMIKRLGIARAIISNPRVLVMDEPTYGVDEETAKIIGDIILDQKKRGVSVLITTKDGKLAKKTCDRVAFLVNGHIKKITSPVDFDKRGKLIEVNYYYKRQIINQMIDTSKPMDRELLANVIRQNGIRTLHSNESTLNDALDYYNQGDDG